MNTGIIITLIICATIIILTAICAVSNMLLRKEVMKRINKFEKAFPTVKPTETRSDNANDDLPKFGDF